MGQSISASTYKKMRRRSLRSPFGPKLSSKSNLSATFNISEDTLRVEQLNINIATEEELMTLPGITRCLAKNIVEHRRLIGRFNKVEDLALVKGIGAEKLDFIRPEICVNTRRKNLSSASSRAQSVDSLDSRATYRSNKLVSVNSANVFDLQCVHGITQEIAANIVHYREKKGPFKNLRELLKVRGIDQIRLSNIASYLTATSDTDDEFLNMKPINTSATSNMENVTNGSLPNGELQTLVNNNNNNNNKKVSTIKLSLKNGLSPSSIYDIFELLSAYSYRPVPEEEFNYHRNGEKAVRIATWNLHELTLEKVRNLGVVEVICCTILENRWSIIAIQEVRDPLALKIICDELNRPALRKIAECKYNGRCWNFCMCDTSCPELGFIYNSVSGDINVDVAYLSHRTLSGCESGIVTFAVDDTDFALMNIYLKSEFIGVVEEKLEALVTDIRGPVLVVGDLNNITGKTAADMKRDVAGLKAVIPLSLNTSCQNVKSNMRYTDTILVNEVVNKEFFTGIWGVVRQGLTHLAIPQGWDWGGPVSPHCPVWGEFYVLPNHGTAL